MSDDPRDHKDPTDAPPPLCCNGGCDGESDLPTACAPPELTEEELAQRKAWDEEAEKAQDVTEKDGVHKEWYKEAGKCCTPDDLTKFIAHLLHDYNHDYGTICHAVTAAAIAAAWTACRDPRQGGITGFQAGAVMWEFIGHWGSKEGPMRLQCYDQMLYPQHGEQFDRQLSQHTWDYLQKQAQEKLDDLKKPGPDENGFPRGANENVIAHWQSIVDGEVPFEYTVKPEAAVEAEDEDDE